MVARRPRGAGAGALLLPLRILPHRAPQCLRQHPLSEHARVSRLLPRIRQPSQRQSAGDSEGDVDGARHVAEPLAVALHSMKFAAIERGDTVAVFGAGPIGLLTIACAEARRSQADLGRRPGGASPRVASRWAPMRRSTRGCGRQILIDTGGRGVDCAIDCAAKEHTTNDAIRAVRNARPVVITGIHSADPRAVRHVAHAAERARGFQRAALEPRNARGAGDAGRARALVCAAGDAHASDGSDRRSVRDRPRLHATELGKWW